MQNKNLFLLVILTTMLCLVSFSIQELRVLAPEKLKDLVTKVNRGKSGEIKSDTGKFGKIPYGKTLNAYTYVEYPNDIPSNDWCEQSKFPYIPNGVGEFFNTYSPIAIAVSGLCSYSQKAKNVQNAKGAGLIIVSNKNDFAEDDNYDDFDGMELTIPTLIIKKESGDILLDYIKNNPNDNIILSLNFTATAQIKGKVNIKLYLRSDQIKAIHFFTEFKNHMKKLGDKLNFTPVYKYTACEYCTSQDDLKVEPVDACFKNGKYCGGFNTDLGIENTRVVLLENLRQKCIWKLFDLEKYWNYMDSFSRVCADLDMPTFNEKCSKEVMDEVKVSRKEVEDCMKSSLSPVTEEDDLLKKDYEDFESNSIYRYPQITINEFKYKDSWMAMKVFNTICETVLFDDEVCKTPSPGKQKIQVSNINNEISVGTIILLVFIIAFCMLIIAYCYRRIVNKTIDESIEDRIFRQTQDSVGNYSKMEKSSIIIN